MKCKPKPLVCILVLLFLPIAELLAQQSHLPVNANTLKIVSLSNDYPYSFRLGDGATTGLFIEFWELWSETTGVPVEFELTTFDKSMALVESNGAIHIGLFKSTKRELWADFSLPYFAVDTGIIYSRKASKTRSLREAGGFTVAVLADSFQAEFLAKNYPTLELYPFIELDGAVRKLVDGEIDAIVGEIPNLDAELSRRDLNGVFSVADEIILSNEVHAVLSKGQPELLETINKGIENIPVSKLIALSKKWLPGVKPFFKDLVSFPALTLAEKKWLSRNHTLSIGAEFNVFPFAFFNENGNFDGLVADYLKHVKETLGIETLPLNQSTWLEQFELFKQNKIDIMFDVVNTPERRKTISFSNPYFSAPNVIAVRKDSFFVDGMESLNDRKVGIVDGYFVELVRRDYPEINIQLVSSIAEGLEKLSTGEIDAHIDMLANVNHTVEKMQLSNVIVAAFTPYKLEFSVAVRKGLEPLIPMLNKVFADMSEKQKSSIANTWLSTQVNTGVDTRTILLWALPTISLLLLIFIVHITRSNRRLKYEISIREQAEQSAISANNAKSEFLSSMSHELRTPLNAVLGFSQLLQMEKSLTDKQVQWIVEIKNAGSHLLGLINEVLDLTKIEMGKIDVTLEPVVVGPLISECISLVNPLTKKHNIGITYENHLQDAIVSADAGRLKQCVINLLSNAVNYNKEDGHILIEVKPTETEHLAISIIDTGIGISQKNLELIFEPFQCVATNHHYIDGAGIGLTITLNMIELMGGQLNVSSEEGKGSSFTIVIPLQTGTGTDTNSDSGSESILEPARERSISS